MSVCILQNLEKYRVLWTDFSASCREINRFSVSKIGPEPEKQTIALALLNTYVSLIFHAQIQPKISCGSGEEVDFVVFAIFSNSGQLGYST